MMNAARKTATSGILSGVAFGLIFSVAPLGCGGQQIPQQLVQQATISPCGGFAQQALVLLEGTRPYCDAEVLNWQYETASQTLKLSDNRVPLNCCGDHDMTIEEQAGLYVVTETDALLDGKFRCNCGCVFDFSIEAKGIADESLELKIVRIVENFEGAPDEQVVFEGALDLTTGSGSVVLDDTDWGTCP